MESWRRELYHHGIRGQKWGVRNGPPYPLKAGNHSASERKAGWRKSLDSQSNNNSVKTSRSGQASPPIRKPMSSKTKRVLIATASVAALTAVGVLAARDPRVRQLAQTGMQSARKALSTSSQTIKDIRLGNQSMNKPSSDFKRELRKATKELKAENKSLRRDNRRFLKERHKAIREREKDILRREKMNSAQLKRAKDEVNKLLKKNNGNKIRINIDGGSASKTLNSGQEFVKQILNLLPSETRTDDAEIRQVSGNVESRQTSTSAENRSGQSTRPSFKRQVRL